MLIKNKILKLERLLHYYDYLYFYLDQPVISDYEYDFLFNKLNFLKKKYCALDVLKERENTFYHLKNNFLCKNHITPMLSLQHIFHISEFIKFYKHLKRILHANNTLYFFCELKFDGLAVSLLYKNKKLIRALTRGNGILGEDVTNNACMIQNIILELKDQDTPDFFEVRGEVCMLNKDFNRLNTQCIKDKKKVFSNTRNAAAGTLRQKDPFVVKKRKLFFYAYHCNIIKGKQDFQYHSEQLYFLYRLGFSISPYILLSSKLNKIINFYSLISKVRDFLSFNIDGVVIKLDSIKLQKKLGNTNQFPRWSIAVKFFSNSAKSKLLSIIYQVGRTGIITPVANLSPTLLSGVIIKKASLYNANVINKLDLHINDSVIVLRVGDVIPKIQSVIFSDRKSHAKKIFFPKYCPSCNSFLSINTSKTIIQCLAGMNCFEQKKKIIGHFFSKHALYAKGFGMLIIEKLILYGYVRNIIDCFKLHQNQISVLKDFGKTSAYNIISAIQSCKYTTLEKFIYALGIQNIGIEHSRLIARYFHSLENIFSCTLEQLLSIKNFGNSNANFFFNFMNDGYNIRYIKKLVKESGLVFQNNKKKYSSTLLSFFTKKNIAFSGRFNKFSRKEIIQKISELGGIVFSNISKNLDLLIIGDRPGNKVFQAAKLNIKILYEKEFMNILS
ncbi:NAD-dependent DNA ligase LigA [Buchnera aphidicola]|uniref:NAD-dependent DNA ligase LigA n=1 Tax=Buchnera aphidicola TaxID=9 RepID=UPI003464583C